jgi:Lsr2
MAKTVIVKLTDDLDGGDADETVHFSLDGKAYEIDLNAANAARLRSALQPYVERGRATGGASGSRAARTTNSSGPKTLFSQLSPEEKARFRAWADMATAKRISDARVNGWVAAGKP